MAATVDAINVPAELQVCLREFTKAVLRDTPEDVLAYAKDYFVEKAQQIRMESYKLPASTSKPFQELSPALQQQIEDVFKRYDSDCDISISLEELRTLMGDLGGLFGFSEEVDASTLMALLDADGNQEISWQEWSHACAVWCVPPPLRPHEYSLACPAPLTTSLSPSILRSHSRLCSALTLPFVYWLWCTHTQAGRHGRWQLRRCRPPFPYGSDCRATTPRGRCTRARAVGCSLRGVAPARTVGRLPALFAPSRAEARPRCSV